MMQFLFVFVMFLILVAVGPVLVAGHHRYLSKRYDVPDLWDLLQQMFRYSDETSSAPVITARLRRRMRGMSVIAVSRTRRALQVHAMRMAPTDIDAIEDTIGLLGLVQDYADAYASFALKNGLKGDTSDPLEIYVISDPKCTPNHPRIGSHRPSGVARPYLVTPGAATAEVPSLIRFTKTPVPAQESAAMEAIATPTTPYGMGRNLSAADATTHLKGMPGAVGSGADVPTQDVRNVPAVLKDGVVVTPLLDGSVMVGRGPECAIRLTDLTVSRNHATIEYRDGNWALVPAEGRICWVNDNAVVEPRRLEAGDVLGFASSPEKFEFHG